MTALVAPGPALSDEERERYGRQLILPGMGDAGQRRLRAARVLVVGAGGLGSPVLLALAAAGVGVLGVVDDDAVELGNLQRQVIHRVADIGRPKTASARDAIAARNPGIEVRAHALRLDARSAAGVLADYDLVVDGSDNFATRYLVDDTAAALGLPLVWGSVLRWEGQVGVVWAERGTRYRDLYPDAPGAALDCATAGVFGPLCALVGAQMAAEAIKLITGAGRPLVGRVVVVDALAAGWREVAFAADGPAEAPGDGETGATADGAVPIVSAAELRAALAGGAAPLVVDVRAPSEPGAIPHAVRWTLDEIEAGEEPPEAVRRALVERREVVVHCALGVRSRRAAEVLRGRPEWRAHPLRSLAGGISAWHALEQATAPTCAAAP
ncbi:molybdopterin-synthase adenylyltransferase MoeB [Microbacterium sp. JZ37]|uniref:molybdopterin-synthase adenylyltransferase MoeB n=1 Tax=Microbacterium sp. JZ37 TaxID=2654193 RepID=UPI002B468AF0|nr:molybdopterin-synthase adenylyltransferase MoeB [Microbacterium sp. JZ37]WRH16081.1 molybdopterin-synthase adenylyltransferase MoeB [Microbacterium sp. JZ37]